MQVMCAGRRRLRSVVSAIVLGTALAGSSHARAPAISTSSATQASDAEALPDATADGPAPGPATTTRVPEVTPRPAPTFTPTPPAPSATAPAYAPAPPPYAPLYAPAPLAPAVVRDARFTDAHVDRVVLVPTAETHPAGTLYLSSYDLVGLQAGYALGDRTQLTLSFVPPLSRDPVVPLDLTLKAVIARSRRVRVAAMASATGIIGLDEAESAIGRVGAVTELCFDDGCRSSVSTAANLSLAGQYLVLADGVGAILRASELFAVLVELQSVLPISREGGQINVLAGALGARLSGRMWAVDLAVEAPLDRRTHPRAVPVFVATVRFF